MTNGILVFEGMTVGILPGDLTISFEESGSALDLNRSDFRDDAERSGRDG